MSEIKEATINTLYGWAKAAGTRFFYKNEAGQVSKLHKASMLKVLTQERKKDKFKWVKIEKDGDNIYLLHEGGKQ